MDRQWTGRGGDARGCLLDAAGAHVPAEFRAGGLGYPRAGGKAEASESGDTAGRFIICDVDVPGAYVFEFVGDDFGGVESGADTEDCG